MSGIRLVLLVALVSVPSSASAQAIQGLALFEQHCASCHAAPAGDSRAPGRDVLRGFTPEAIFAALTTGSMSVVTPTMSEPQKRLVSEFLAGRPMGAATSGHASAMKNRCAATAFRNPLEGPAWNGWGNNPANTRFQTADHAGLPAAMVPKLQLKWAFAFPDGRSAFGQPTVAGGRIARYGLERAGGLSAINTATGERVWFSRPRPTCAEPTCVPALSAAATAIPGAVFSGGTDGWLRAFDTRDNVLLAFSVEGK